MLMQLLNNNYPEWSHISGNTGTRKVISLCFVIDCCFIYNINLRYKNTLQNKYINSIYFTYFANDFSCYFKNKWNPIYAMFLCLVLRSVVYHNIKKLQKFGNCHHNSFCRLEHCFHHAHRCCQIKAMRFCW